MSSFGSSLKGINNYSEFGMSNVLQKYSKRVWNRWYKTHLFEIKNQLSSLKKRKSRNKCFKIDMKKQTNHVTQIISYINH